MCLRSHFRPGKEHCTLPSTNSKPEMASLLCVLATAVGVAIEGRFTQQGTAEALQLEEVLIALARTDVGPNDLTMLQEFCDYLGIFYIFQTSV